MKTKYIQIRLGFFGWVLQLILTILCVFDLEYFLIWEASRGMFSE